MDASGCGIWKYVFGFSVICFASLGYPNPIVHICLRYGDALGTYCISSFGVCWVVVGHPYSVCWSEAELIVVGWYGTTVAMLMTKNYLNLRLQVKHLACMYLNQFLLMFGGGSTSAKVGLTTVIFCFKIYGYY
ncbi:hypothetical protein NE237_003803 [Protea cynaroides]|uniref:Uncharacterized protein n=1 Tax=Protea cynaroides TaxID=273540 RepID=A0A9Q0KI65_9MAGN|nr:hypothetical protein NE237_003803 [Protea cynaroides]